MSYVTFGRVLLLVLLAVVAMTALAATPAVLIQLVVRAAFLVGGVAIVLALRPRS